MSNRLVIVPCGQRKIWGKYPDSGSVQACDAYTGPAFKVNRQYAEMTGGKWLILSAKHGFISPELLLPGPYEVTFKRKQTNPITEQELKDQVRSQNLGQFEVIIGLGGKEYINAIKKAFAECNSKLEFPFAGLRIGKMMHETKKAIDAENRNK